MGTAASEEQYILQESVFVMLKAFTVNRTELFYHERTAPHLLKFQNIYIKLFFENTLGNKNLVHEKKRPELLQLILSECLYN